jgi:hypothetical protein
MLARRIAILVVCVFTLVACVHCMSDITKNAARLIAHDEDRTAQQADQ